MGLTGALQIGSSALNAAQLALQVAGNNIANAATPGYSRQLAYLIPTRPDSGGRITVGTGVRVADIRRQHDAALQARVWAGVSSEAAAHQQSQLLAQIESTLGELSGNDLSSELTNYFNVWSDRANLVQSSAVVVQQGQRLADFVRRLRADLSEQRNQIDATLADQAQRADGILTQIAELNTTIAGAEAGGGTANSLRDQRDQLITELSQFMDVTAIEQGFGGVDILVGSTPVVLAGTSRGIELKRETVDGELEVSISVRADGQDLDIDSGSLGALLENRQAHLTATIDRLDNVASNLIFEVNRLHSTGSNKDGLTTTTGTLSIALADRTRSLNDPANDSLDLPFHAENGGFFVSVRQVSTGAVERIRVDVDLDGRDAAGLPGFTDDTTPEDIRAAIDAIDGVSASFTADGKLQVDADAGFDFAFADDSSGALAVLGVNSYFTGTDAADIAVRTELADNPGLLMVGRVIDGAFVENGTALAIAGLTDTAITALGDQSIKDAWTDAAQRVGVAASSADTRAKAATIVRESLDAQRAALSGVSIDEESINLLNFQRQYQGAARFISTVDELTQILVNLV